MIHMPVDRETWRSAPCKLCGDPADVESDYCVLCGHERMMAMDRRDAARHAASHEERSGRG